jgi:hypothetical protein
MRRGTRNRRSLARALRFAESFAALGRLQLEPSGFCCREFVTRCPPFDLARKSKESNANGAKQAAPQTREVRGSSGCACRSCVLQKSKTGVAAKKRHWESPLTTGAQRRGQGASQHG